MSADTSTQSELTPNPELAKYNAACLELLTFTTDLITQGKPGWISLAAQKHQEIATQQGLDPKLLGQRMTLLGQCGQTLLDLAGALGINLTSEEIKPTEAQLAALHEEKQAILTANSLTDSLIKAQFNYYGALVTAQQNEA